MRFAPLLALYLGTHFSTAGHAVPITVDPSAYPSGTDLNGLLPGVELSSAQGSVVVFDTTVTQPLALTSDARGPVFASGNSFAHSNGSIWSAGQCCGSDTVLRADFSGIVTSVSWLFSPDDTDTGFLQVYDALDNLLGESIFRSNVAFALTLNANDISYAVATFGDTGRLGPFTFETVSVPEPGTLSLFAAGVFAFYIRRRRKRT